ncbi:MAG: YDG domain-containing protein, partial [Pseudomonadota bacterium]
VWRIYEGNTGPLLRSFLTQLTLLPEYDGSGNALDHVGDIVAPVGTDTAKLFGTASGTDTLTLDSNGLAGSHTATSSATGAGLYSNQKGYDIVGVAPRTINTPGSAAGDVRIDNPLDWTDGTLKINALGSINFGGNTVSGGFGSALELNAGTTISNAGDLMVDLFDLKAGTWSQVGSAEPMFYADDFRISGGTYIRALGGDGLSTATAYQLNDIFGLQGVGSAGMLDKHYILADDIYAGGTFCWNLCGTSYAGFRPMGDGSTPFTGTFNGNNYEIRNLFINQSSGTNVALFGTTGATSHIHDLYLADVDVTGYGNVAALVGTNAGAINNVHVSGFVAGQSSGGAVVGGLVGANNGSIDNSTADVEVSGFALVGGLVGNNVTASISNSHATGKVSGASTGVGGLVGNNDADSTIADSWASATVDSTGANTGGLVGLNSGGITRSYASGDVSGAAYLGGLVGLNAGAIDKSHASGIVTSTGGSGVGGLVGYNADGSIENSYASGAVVAASSTEVGGLVGLNEASIAYSYATGLLDGGSNTGGLVGLNDGTGSVSNSVWDKQTTAQDHSSGSADADGKTSAEMKQAATFSGWNIASEGGSSAIWRIYEGQTGPLLRNFMTGLVLADTTVTYNANTQTGASTAVAGVTGSASSGRNAGSYSSGYYSGQHGYDISGGGLTINKADLALTGLTTADRAYDGTTDAILNGSAQITALGSDDVTLSGTATGTFADKNAGVDKAVTVTGNTLAGIDAGNYNLIQPAGLKATIERKELTATATASDKVYTGGTSAKAELTVTSGLVNGETLSIRNLASFDSKDVATAGLVTVNKIGLYDGDNGGLASNYRIVAGQTANARITAKNIRVAGKRAYDGSTDMQANIFGTAGTLKGVNGETVQLTGTGSVASKNVLAGTQTLNTSGLALADGTGQASNYNLLAGTARVYRKDLTATATASDKVYDGNNVASAALTITGGLVGT